MFELFIHYIDKDGIKLPRPSCYARHMCFVDFSEFNRTNPIYINIVRRPLDRIVSWYYYVRSPRYMFAEKPKDRTIPSLKKMKTSFEDCVNNNLLECTYERGNAYIWKLYSGRNSFTHLRWYFSYYLLCVCSNFLMLYR